MGEPMCRNLVTRTEELAEHVKIYDLQDAPQQRLEQAGALRTQSIASLVDTVDIVFLSLPGGAEVESVLTNSDGILSHAHTGLTVVDLSTSPVGLTRELAEKSQALGVAYADAPVARTRAAAIDGTLAIMVGATATVFKKIRPLLDCMASDITHCGEVGAGQLVKILNNMVLFQTVSSLAEALTLARRSGVNGDVLFEALQQGSADSFALRNHGMKALLTDEFPEQAFSTRYALKDLAYALQLADETNTETAGARMVKTLFENTIDAGFGDNYWPALLKTIDK
jgi:3-hydroxyisobutyrate dehydrogenase-like beta-hydroxyacid dehydrogenase